MFDTSSRQVPPAARAAQSRTGKRRLVSAAWLLPAAAALTLTAGCGSSSTGSKAAAPAPAPSKATSSAPSELGGAMPVADVSADPSKVGTASSHGLVLNVVNNSSHDLH